MVDPMLTEVEDFLGRYLVLRDDERQIVALWVLHTWQFSEQCITPNVTPYLYIHSAQKGSGKTLVIDLLETIVRNPIRATDMSASTLFRLIEQIQPTIMLDEVDTIWSGGKHEDLRGTLNGGYRRGGHVWRTENLEPRKFGTFGPKLLAGIDNLQLPDTIRDRCIPISLKRATREELDSISPFYHYEVEEECAQLADRLHAWSFAVTERLRDYRPEVIRELSPRQWEISMSLISMAHVCGVERSTRKALTRILTASEPGRTIEQDMLDLIRSAFGEADRIAGAELLAYLAGEDVRFSGLTGKGLSVKLAPFGIRPVTIRIANQTHKGYHKSAFADAWERYL